MYKNIIARLKNKKGMNQSVEYVLYFFITVLLIFIFLEVILAFQTLYATHVTATNVARVVSLNGGYDTDTSNNIVDSKDLYQMAKEQIGARLYDEDTLTLTFNDDNGNSYILTSEQQNGTYEVNLGESFTVKVSGDVVLCSIAEVPITVNISSTSSGVSEVYHKTGG